MPDFKRYLFLFLILGLAFAWGYKKEFIFEKIDQLTNEQSTTPSSPKAGEPRSPTAKQPKLTPPDAQPNTRMKPAAPSTNPYQRFMTKPRSGPNSNTGGLANTLDSIRREGIEDKQIIRRNAYFEKLSQQLKELRGETPKNNVKNTERIEAEDKSTAPPSSLPQRRTDRPARRAPEPLPEPLPEELPSDEFAPLEPPPAGEDIDEIEAEQRLLEEELNRLEQDILAE